MEQPDLRGTNIDIVDDPAKNAKMLVQLFFDPLLTADEDQNTNLKRCWRQAKAMATNVCKVMLMEHSCYTLNQQRHEHWTLVAFHIGLL